MLKIDTHFDPIVEILRLAYRRGLAVCQTQSENETVDSGNLGRETLSTAEQKDSKEMKSYQ